MNSRDKGCRGEREFANFLSDRGYEARRGQQFCGGEESPDVVCRSLSAFHFEVKRTERLQLYPAYEQAEGDSGETQIPVVAHRKNRKNWLVILDAEDFLALLNGANS